ncbi:hypothetical protein F5146DRAFT_1130485 [Armillaria mellea]|nr:hypothetical protein F5146DRAFT_1130485 [Armillaria mellea]
MSTNHFQSQSYRTSQIVIYDLPGTEIEKDFEVAFSKQQEEWTYVAALLLALIAMNTTVFSVTSDSEFQVTSSSRLTVATSAITSGLGLICLGQYVFFTFSARIPMLCLVVSSMWLLAFVGIMAYVISADAVLVVSIFVGAGMTAQVWVFAAYWCAEESGARSEDSVQRKVLTW